MEKLTQIQIEKGLEHWFKYESPDKSVVELEEYSGEKELSINCTQLDGYPYNPKYKSAREKKRVLSEWCEFLTEKIEGNVWSPQYIHIDSLDFLREMKQLRSFTLTTARVKSKDYTPILELENIEYLLIESRKEVKAIYDQVMKLPKLKYGTLIEHPELYKS